MQELYRTTAPLPALKPGRHDLNLTRVTFPPQTPSNAEALDVLVQSYDKLGMIQLADDARRILAQTYPDSKYVTGLGDKPWWKIWSPQDTTFGVTPTGELATKPWWQFW